MPGQIKISRREKILIIYIALAVVTLSVFWQVNHFDFVNFDDVDYVTENVYIKSGFSLEGLHWAFSTTTHHIWNPLIWLSLMLDYQLFGPNAGGYHMTNLILHMLSTLLLFWLFCRMTGEIWKSAFVAAFFGIHPLHVESVAWIAERKDVLSGFLGMLTLCLYVYYTEKPIISRYLLVLFGFILALLSKPMVITLPIMMILIDYWPLRRFDSKRSNPILWQLKEKMPFFVLSVFFTVITILIMYLPNAKYFSLSSRLTNAPVAFVIYLGKTFWPHNMAVFYPFPAHVPSWQVIGASLLIIFITIFVTVMIKRSPYLFVGWLWFSITLLPVIGIIQNGYYAMADRYHYLPSIGIAIMLAWCVSSFIKSKEIRKKILLPAGVTFLLIMSLLAWKQCGYWKNNFDLFNHAALVTKNNYLAHTHRGVDYAKMGYYQLAMEDFNKAIRSNPNYEKAYYNLGKIYADFRQYKLAIEKYDAAIRIKPDYADAYYNKGIANFYLAQYQQSINNYTQTIHLKPDYAEAFNNRGAAFTKLGQNLRAIEDFNKAISIVPTYVNAYYNRGLTYRSVGQYKKAIEDFNNVIRLRPDYTSAYYDRESAYSMLGQNSHALEDVNKADRLSRKKSLN